MKPSTSVRAGHGVAGLFAALLASGLTILGAPLAAQQPPAQPVAPPPPAPPAPPLPPLPPPPPGREMNITIVRDGAGGPETRLFMSGGSGVDFVSMPLAMGGEPVAGAPYSAEAITEVVQTLSDGNRISRQSKAALYRDAQGRTRREGGLSVLGGLVGGPGPVAPAADPGAPGANDDARIQIHDPEAGTMFLLDPERKQAHRLPAPRLRITKGGTAGAHVPGGPEPGPTVRRFEMRHGPGVPGDITASSGDVTTIVRHGREVRDTRVESLGTRSLEGVQAEGTRTTMTIPAGQIGNERPIEIVSERWYSPELRLLVMSRHSDPRFGETTYRLANIVRAEPAPDLFRVPPDYRVVDRLKDLDGLGDRIRRTVDERLQHARPNPRTERRERRSDPPRE